MEMECSGGNSVPDEYEADTDEDNSLSKSEVLPKNKAGNPGNENIDRMDDALPDSSKTASRYIYIYICMYHMSCINRKQDYCLCENKGADQLCNNCTADQRLCFCYMYTDSSVQFLLYLYPKFQDSSLLLHVYRLVCVGPGRKP